MIATADKQRSDPWIGEALAIVVGGGAAHDRTIGGGAARACPDRCINDCIYGCVCWNNQSMMHYAVDKFTNGRR